MKRNTSGLRPPVRSREEAQELASHGAGRPSLDVKTVSVKLRNDQITELDRRKLNRSELIRTLLDEYLSK